MNKNYHKYWAHGPKWCDCCRKLQPNEGGAYRPKTKLTQGWYCKTCLERMEK